MPPAANFHEDFSVTASKLRFFNQLGFNFLSVSWCLKNSCASSCSLTGKNGRGILFYFTFILWHSVRYYIKTHKKWHAAPMRSKVIILQHNRLDSNILVSANKKTVQILGTKVFLQGQTATERTWLFTPDGFLLMSHSHVCPFNQMFTYNLDYRLQSLLLLECKWPSDPVVD